jgi:hypothetical protein
MSTHHDGARSQNSSPRSGELRVPDAPCRIPNQCDRTGTVRRGSHTGHSRRSIEPHGEPLAGITGSPLTRVTLGDHDGHPVTIDLASIGGILVGPDAGDVPRAVVVDFLATPRRVIMCDRATAELLFPDASDALACRSLTTSRPRYPWSRSSSSPARSPRPSR